MFLYKSKNNCKCLPSPPISVIVKIIYQYCNILILANPSTKPLSQSHPVSYTRIIVMSACNNKFTVYILEVRHMIDICFCLKIFLNLLNISHTLIHNISIIYIVIASVPAAHIFHSCNLISIVKTLTCYPLTSFFYHNAPQHLSYSSPQGTTLRLVNQPLS